MLQLKSSVWTTDESACPELMLRSMLSHNFYNAIIDVGAFFKGIRNEDVARILAKIFKENEQAVLLSPKRKLREKIIKVLYFNTEDQLCALSIDGRCDVIG